MTTSQGWFGFSAVVAIVVSAIASADFKASLEPMTIRPGERATLTLRLPEKDLVRPEGALEELLPEADDEQLLKTDNLELLDQEYRKEAGEYVWRYQFTSYNLGDLVVPAIAITLGPQTFSSERSIVKVQTHRPPGDEDLRDEAGAVRAPIDWSFWARVFLVLGLGTLAYFTRYRWLKVPKLQEPTAPPPPIEDPLVWLRKQLLRLKARLDATPNDGHAPDAWSGIVREFGSRQKHVPATAWTTRELAERLGQDSKWIQIAQLMKECDRLRFTGGSREGISAGKATLKWISESEKTWL